MGNSKYLYIQEQKNRQYKEDLKELKAYWKNILGEDAIRNVEKFYGIQFTGILYSEEKNVSDDNDLISKIKAFEDTLFDKKNKGSTRKFKYKKKLIFSNFFFHFIQYAISQKSLNLAPVIEKSYIEMLLTRLCKISISTLIFEMYIEKQNDTLQGETAEQEYNYYNEKILTDTTYIKKIFSIYPCLAMSST